MIDVIQTGKETNNSPLQSKYAATKKNYQRKIPTTLLSPHERQVRVQRLVTVALVGELLGPREKALSVLLDRLLDLLGRAPAVTSAVQQTLLIL